MSSTQLERFQRITESSPELQKQLRAVLARHSDKRDSLIALAASVGCELTDDDARRLAGQHSDNTELSDETLDAIAGGRTGSTVESGSTSSTSLRDTLTRQTTSYSAIEPTSVESADSPTADSTQDTDASVDESPIADLAAPPPGYVYDENGKLVAAEDSTGSDSSGEPTLESDQDRDRDAAVDSPPADTTQETAAGVDESPIPNLAAPPPGYVYDENGQLVAAEDSTGSPSADTDAAADETPIPNLAAPPPGYVYDENGQLVAAEDSDGSESSGESEKADTAEPERDGSGDATSDSAPADETQGTAAKFDESPIADLAAPPPGYVYDENGKLMAVEDSTSNESKK